MTTRDRIRRLQSHLDVSVDGIIGPKTLTALEETIGIAEDHIIYDDNTLEGWEFDERTQHNLSTLQPAARERFVPFVAAAQALAAAYGAEYTAINGLRTFDEQAALYAKGRSQPGNIVTNARPGSSWHNYGVALDFGVFDSGRYLDSVNPKRATAIHKAVGELATDYGLEWGGNWTSFVDLPHYQLPMDISLAQAQQLHEQGQPII